MWLLEFCPNLGWLQQNCLSFRRQYRIISWKIVNFNRKYDELCSSQFVEWAVSKHQIWLTNKWAWVIHSYYIRQYLYLLSNRLLGIRFRLLIGKVFCSFYSNSFRIYIKIEFTTIKDIRKMWRVHWRWYGSSSFKNLLRTETAWNRTLY